MTSKCDFHVLYIPEVHFQIGAEWNDTIEGLMGFDINFGFDKSQHMYWD